MASPIKALPKPSAGQPCPCGSGKLFDACCEPIHTGARLPETAEQLMRARFSAHVAQNFEFLHKSWLESSKQPYVPEEETGQSPWTRLVIHSHEMGTTADMAYVDFTAYYEGEHEELAHHEKAEFSRINGAWIYTRPVRQGPAPIKVQTKAGRNDPCPCGSGKKYKQCCLK